MDIISNNPPRSNPALPPLQAKAFFRWGANDETEILCPECEGRGQYAYHPGPDGTRPIDFPKNRTARRYHGGWWWKDCFQCHGREYVTFGALFPGDIVLLNEMAERYSGHE